MERSQKELLYYLNPTAIRYPTLDAGSLADEIFFILDAEVMWEVYYLKSVI